MKVLYMQDTIQLMSHGKAREVEDLISSGVLKQTQEGINYLLTIIEDGDTTSTTIQSEI